MEIRLQLVLLVYAGKIMEGETAVFSGYYVAVKMLIGAKLINQ